MAPRIKPLTPEQRAREYLWRQKEKFKPKKNKGMRVAPKETRIRVASLGGIARALKYKKLREEI